MKKQSAVPNRVFVRELADPVDMPLPELKGIIEKIEKKYGKRARIGFSAGYNNVDCWVKPSRKQKKRK